MCHDGKSVKEQRRIKKTGRTEASIFKKVKDCVSAERRVIISFWSWKGWRSWGTENRKEKLGGARESSGNSSVISL